MAKVLCLPKSFRKLCGISLLVLSERLDMVVEPSFEFVLGTPNVCLEGVAAEFVASALYTALYAYLSFSFSLYA